MSFVKPLAAAAAISLALAACAKEEETTVDTTADTGMAADTGSMSSTAPTTVNPAPTDTMGTMGTTGTPGSPSDTTGMGTTTTPPPAMPK